jgi:high-affinity iron transporter
MPEESMGATILITFRESLEAFLVLGLVLAVLGKSGHGRLIPWVWVGLAAGIAASLATAWLFVSLLGQFDGREEQLFEGIVMSLGAILLATLILWTGSHSLGSGLEEEASSAALGGPWGIGALVFLSILREGVETVIYLGSSLSQGGEGLFVGGLVGLSLALGLAFWISTAGRRIQLRRFFGTVTTILVLFGAGLFARAAGEFGEAGLLPPLVEGVWKIFPATPGSPVPALNQDGLVGSFLKGLFGYSSSPSLSQILAWLLFVGAVFALLWLKPAGKPAPRTRA